MNIKLWSIQAAILLALTPAVCAGGMFDDLFNKAKKEAEKATQTITDEGGEKESAPAPDNSSASSSGPATQAPQQQSVSGSTAVRNGEIDGVKLGMPFDDALATLKKRGYDVRRKSKACAEHRDYQTNPCRSELIGVRVELNARQGKGFSSVTLTHVDGTVYEVKRVLWYKVSDLPEGVSAETLRTRYKNTFGGGYESESGGGRRITLEFDDTMPPPYSRPKITSPHATVYIENGGRGRFTTMVRMIWQDLVGVRW